MIDAGYMNKIDLKDQILYIVESALRKVLLDAEVQLTPDQIEVTWRNKSVNVTIPINETLDFNELSKANLIYDIIYERILIDIEEKLRHKAPAYFYGIKDPNIFSQNFTELINNIVGCQIMYSNVIGSSNELRFICIPAKCPVEAIIDYSMQPSSLTARILINWVLSILQSCFEEERP